MEAYIVESEYKQKTELHRHLLLSIKKLINEQDTDEKKLNIYKSFDDSVTQVVKLEK